MTATDTQVASALLSFMDHETDAEALDCAKRVLLLLLRSHGATAPSVWLKMLCSTVQDVKKLGGSADKSEATRRDADDEGGTEEAEEGGGWDQNASGLPSGDMDEDEEESRRRHKERQVEAEEEAKWELMTPRWQTRLFAVECVRRLIATVGGPTHFSLTLARQQPHEDMLVNSLQQLVSVSFTVATSTIEAMRPQGVVTLLDVVDKFGEQEDPDVDGHALLEQYHAQISSALRACFSADAEPPLAAAGCALLSRYLISVSSTARGRQVDAIAIRKLLVLLTKIVSRDGLQALQYPALSEHAATMVRTAALQAAAQLQVAAVHAPEHHAELASQLTPWLFELRSCWMATLCDFAALEAVPKLARRAYRPYLHAGTAAAESRHHIAHAAPVVLEAVVTLVRDAAWLDERDAKEEAQAPVADSVADVASQSQQRITVRSAEADGGLLLGLCCHALESKAALLAQAHRADEPLCLIAISALKALLTPERYLTPQAVPPTELLLLLGQLRALAVQPTAALELRRKVAELAVQLMGDVGGYVCAIQGGESALLGELQRLAAAPLFHALPHLAKLSTAPQSVAGPISESEAPLVCLALHALSALPASLPEAPKMAILPTSLLAVLQAAAGCAASASAPQQLADECTRSLGELLALCDVSQPSALALLHSAAETVLQLHARSGAASGAAASLSVPLLFKLAQQVPLLTDAEAQLHGRVGAALVGLLSSAEHVVQQAALRAFASFLHASGASALGVKYMRAMLPDVAALLVREGGTDRIDAVKALLLACTVCPAEASTSLLSLALPLFVGCLWLAADGSPSAAQKEVSALVHASLTALAKRAPTDFRQAVAAFTPATRSRMEMALKEAAASASNTAQSREAAAKPASAGVASQPKIALRMDFGSFGAK